MNIYIDLFQDIGETVRKLESTDLTGESLEIWICNHRFFGRFQQQPNDSAILLSQTQSVVELLQSKKKMMIEKLDLFAIERDDEEAQEESCVGHLPRFLNLFAEAGLRIKSLSLFGVFLGEMEALVAALTAIASGLENVCVRLDADYPSPLNSIDARQLATAVSSLPDIKEISWEFAYNRPSRNIHRNQSPRDAQIECDISKTFYSVKQLEKLTLNLNYPVQVLQTLATVDLLDEVESVQKLELSCSHRHVPFNEYQEALHEAINLLHYNRSLVELETHYLGRMESAANRHLLQEKNALLRENETIRAIKNGTDIDGKPPFYKWLQILGIMTSKANVGGTAHTDKACLQGIHLFLNKTIANGLIPALNGALVLCGDAKDTKPPAFVPPSFTASVLPTSNVNNATGGTLGNTLKTRPLRATTELRMLGFGSSSDGHNEFESASSTMPRTRSTTTSTNGDRIISKMAAVQDKRTATAHVTKNSNAKGKKEASGATRPKNHIATSISASLVPGNAEGKNKDITTTQIHQSPNVAKKERATTSKNASTRHRSDQVKREATTALLSSCPSDCPSKKAKTSSNCAIEKRTTVRMNDSDYRWG